jgi:hypothetical protein
MRRLILALAAVATATACTPAQIAEWARWYERDPAAALEFANRPEIKELLHRPAAPEPQISQTNVWDQLAECESGQRWSYNGGSGYDGGLQFLPSTWRAYGGREYAEFAWQASREQQIDIAERVLADVGWRAWPACSRKLGLR